MRADASTTRERKREKKNKEEKFDNNKRNFEKRSKKSFEIVIIIDFQKILYFQEMKNYS